MATDPSLVPHRRYNPLTGEHVLVSPQRGKRPWQGAQESQAPAPAITPSQPHRAWASAVNVRSVASAVRAAPVVPVPQVDVTPAAAHPAPLVTVVPVPQVQITEQHAPQAVATHALQVQTTVLPAPQAAVQVATAPHPT